MEQFFTAIENHITVSICLTFLLVWVIDQALKRNSK